MEERLREMFREEMSAEQEPPLRGLVEGAVHEGRHQRRRRRAWFTAATTGVAAALAVTAFVVVPGNGEGSAGTTATAGTNGTSGKAGAQNPVLELASSSTSTVIEQPRGPKLPVTDAAVVEQLARLVPQGRTSGYAKGSKEADRYAFGQIYLDTGKGPGMIRAFIHKGGLSAATCSTKPTAHVVAALRAKFDQERKAAKTEAARQQIEQQFRAMATQRLPGCRDLPGGGRVYVNPHSTGVNDVWVDHGNGVTVEIFTTTWLAFNGKENPPGTVALTRAQALKIAEYPGWGPKMDASLVRKAAKDYPSLPTVY
jgi:hypothetical protein